MENERPLTAAPSDVPPAQPLSTVPDSIGVGALEQTYSPDYSVAQDTSYIEHQRSRLRWVARWLAAGGAIVLLLIAAMLVWLRSGERTTSVRSGNYNVVSVPLSGITPPRISGSDTLRVDGSIRAAQSIIITPTDRPVNPAAGQLYYDKTANQLTFYDGQGFLNLGATSNTNTTNTTNVINLTNVLSGAGNGVQLQATSPGVQQNGNLNVSGTGTLGKLQTAVIDSGGGTLYINPISAAAQQTVSAGTPVTTGLTSGSSTTGTGWANDLSATKITTSNVGGAVSSMSVFYNNGTGTSHVQLAIYDDDGNVPSRPANLLATSAVVSLTPNGTTTVTMPAITLAANTTYWLAVNTDDTTVTRTYDAGNKTSCFSSTIFGFMPDPFSTGACFFDNASYSISLVYTAGGGTNGSVSQASISVGPTGQVLFQNAADSSTALQVQNAAGTSVFSVDTINGRVGIGKTTPTSKLDIAGGDINLSNGHALKFGGLQVISTSSDAQTTVISNFVSGGKVSAQADSFAVQDANANHQNLLIDSDGAATFSNKNDSTLGFQIQNAANTATIFSVDTTNQIVTVTNLAVTKHIITSGSAPGIAAGAAACASPAVSVAGNDTSGIITVTTGTGCAASGSLGTITFTDAFGAVPHIVLTPGSASAQALGAYVDDAATNATSFVLGTAGTPADTTTYKWNYIIMQ